jgi:hypothetical protein
MQEEVELISRRQGWSARAKVGHEALNTGILLEGEGFRREIIGARESSTC